MKFESERNKPGISSSRLAEMIVGEQKIAEQTRRLINDIQKLLGQERPSGIAGKLQLHSCLGVRDRARLQSSYYGRDGENPCLTTSDLIGALKRTALHVSQAASKRYDYNE